MGSRTPPHHPARGQLGVGRLCRDPQLEPSQRWLVVLLAGRAPAGWSRVQLGGQEPPGGAGGAAGRGFLPCRTQILPSLAPGQLRSSWTRRIAWDTREYREPKPGVRDGFLGSGSGLLGRSGGGIRAQARRWGWESRWPRLGLGLSHAMAGGRGWGCWVALPGQTLASRLPEASPSAAFIPQGPPGILGPKGDKVGAVAGWPAGGCAQCRCAMTTGMQPLRSRLHRGARALGSRLLGASWGPPQGPPQPGAASHCPHRAG